MRAGITEVDQQPVAHVPGYKAAIRVDYGGNGLVVVGDQVAQVFRIEPRRERSGTDKIAKHHRELPTLCSVLWQRRLDLSRMRRNRRAWHLEPGDRPQHPLAMPEQHAELLEVGFSEFGQYLKVDGIGAKDRLVFRQREFSQPVVDIHGLIPPGHRHLASSRWRLPSDGLLQAKFQVSLVMISLNQPAYRRPASYLEVGLRSKRLAVGPGSIRATTYAKGAERPSTSRRSAPEVIRGFIASAT